MKFCLLVPEEFASHHRQHSFEITGLLQWGKALGGDIKTLTEFDGGYDWVMTNVSSTESEYISFIHQVDPDAKVIACFDYGFDVVNQYFVPAAIARIKDVMNRADVVFSVNKNQQAWMQEILPDKTIHYCPHPTDIESIAKFRRKKEERTQGVAYFWHQYDNYQIQGLEVLKAVERRIKRPIPKALIGLKSRILMQQGIPILSAGFPFVANDHPDEKIRNQPLDPELYKIWQRTPPGISWDTVMPYMGVEMWYHFLSQFDVCLDLYTVNSIGRFGIDCAALGLPLVASDKQDSSKLLWPFTTVDPYSPEDAIAFMVKLIKKDDFYDKCERVAMKNVHHFGLEKSKERMMRILDSD